MKRKSFKIAMALMLSCSLAFTSCIGSFNLTNKLLSWNNSIDSKFVNELVFIAFHIVPIYEITILADIVVLNSIEFWTGENVVAEGTVKNIEAESGSYAIETKADGYHIVKDGDEVVDLIFDAEDKSWSVNANGESCELLRFGDNNEVVMYLPDGETMTVQADAAGVMAFRQIANNFGFYAAK